MDTKSRISTIIFLIIGLLLFSYLLYITTVPVDVSNITGGTVIVATSQSGSNPPSLSSLPNNPDTNTVPLNYTFSTWVYVNEWNTGYGKDKLLLNSPTLYIALGKNEPSLKVITSNGTCNAGNIALQKWVHIGCIVSSSSIDTYINGRLRTSCVLQGIPMNLSSHSISVPTSGIGGIFARTIVWPIALLPNQMYSLYENGYSGNSYSSFIGGGSSYNITLSNNQQQQQQC